jgi:putative membrane protein
MERTSSNSSSNRTLWIGLGILAVLALIASSWGGGMMFGRGMVGPFGVRPFIGAPWLIGVWGFGLLIRLLFVGGLIFLVVRLFGPRRRRYYREDDYIHSAELTPSEILRRRYAAGEITREQYEDMRRTLEPTSA